MCIRNIYEESYIVQMKYIRLNVTLGVIIVNV